MESRSEVAYEPGTYRWAWLKSSYLNGGHPSSIPRRSAPSSN